MTDPFYRSRTQRFAWFVSDVTRKDFNWLLNSMVYGHLFPEASDDQVASLKAMGLRWKEYVKKGAWVYEEHPFWISGYTVSLSSLFLILSLSLSSISFHTEL